MKYLFKRGAVNISDVQGNRGGFLVIFEDTALYTIYDSVGHDDLLRDVAAQKKIDPARVLQNGIRLYFTFIDGGILISGVREIDNDEIETDIQHYGKIIRRAME